VTDLEITLPDGRTISLAQALVVRRLIDQLGVSHWHLNDCGCCVTVHGRDCAYVIDSDGNETFFPWRGCDCGADQ
jgi:hypothetical protein